MRPFNQEAEGGRTTLVIVLSWRPSLVSTSPEIKIFTIQGYRFIRYLIYSWSASSGQQGYSLSDQQAPSLRMRLIFSLFFFFNSKLLIFIYEAEDVKLLVIKLQEVKDSTLQHEVSTTAVERETRPTEIIYQEGRVTCCSVSFWFFVIFLDFLDNNIKAVKCRVILSSLTLSLICCLYKCTAIYPFTAKLFFYNKALALL